MCFHETTWMAKCPIEFKPKLCYRYVDDYIFGFEKKEHVEKFLNYLNNQHDSIKFTCKEEENQTLNYLDLSIKHQNGRFSTTTYRKPTYTGLGTNFFSFVPHKYKSNSLQTLINRAYSTCSDWISFDEEIQFLTINIHSRSSNPKSEPFSSTSTNPNRRLQQYRKKLFTSSYRS